MSRAQDSTTLSGLLHLSIGSAEIEPALQSRSDSASPDPAPAERARREREGGAESEI
jgi:hypothetical protein